MANEKQSKETYTTALSQWTDTVTNLVTTDFRNVNVPFDDYSKKCAMDAVSAIFALTKANNINLKTIDQSNLRSVVGQAASLKLNPNAVPRECYFQLRKKRMPDGHYEQFVEMGIEGDGNDALLRNFGANVKTVYPCWLVKEGDDFTYPKRKGLKTEPPEWEEKGLSDKTIRVVYPVELKSGVVEYLISERSSVKVNLFAHVNNNLMNETFGICDNVYKATAKQKAEIKAKKEEVFEALRACETVDDMLSCEIARPYMSPAWLNTPESMIIRKMRNNATKRFPKNMNVMANTSMTELDETYKARKEEEAQAANSEEFVPEDADVIVDAEIVEDVEVVEGEVVEQ